MGKVGTVVEMRRALEARWRRGAIGADVEKKREKKKKGNMTRNMYLSGIGRNSCGKEEDLGGAMAKGRLRSSNRKEMGQEIKNK